MNVYNLLMADPKKRKYMIYFREEEARRFEMVYARALKNVNGRTNWSEIIKELMGFPLKEGIESAITDSERDIIRFGETKDESRTSTGFLKATSGERIGRGKKHN